VGMGIRVLGTVSDVDILGATGLHHPSVLYSCYV